MGTLKVKLACAFLIVGKLIDEQKQQNRYKTLLPAAAKCFKRILACLPCAFFRF